VGARAQPWQGPQNKSQEELRKRGDMEQLGLGGKFLLHYSTTKES
jgi:hypothetical protein